ncbi:MAG: hypothetical protein Q4E66_13555, partial [Comamonadaceae bacterium]|nr:hypothetical protein [Comamonadaceae bacterium]
MRKAHWGVLGLVGALMLTACASAPQVQQPQAPASAAEEQRQRLAQTRLQLAALHFQEGRNDVALNELEQSLQ